MVVGSDGVKALLAKISSSAMFARSRRLQRFLSFVTEWTLEHPGEPLKEYAIALAVYDKPSSFDPQADPIIRVEASRLRSRLREYYAGPGRDDEIVLELPKGSYTPLIRTRAQQRPAAQSPSIAVIPWVDRPDEDLLYVVLGMCESITRRLAHIPNVRVAPWTMVARLRSPEEDPVRTSEELAVKTLLILRLIRRGENCEVRAEWIDPQQKTHLWGARHDRKLQELPYLEDEITVDVAQRIAPHLTKAELAEVRKQYTTNGRAYEFYLKGRHLWNKRTVDAISNAIRHYERALEYDPAFALGFAGIADCYLNLATFTFVSPRDSMPRAKAAVTRALQIDPNLGEARATLACIRALYDWDWDEAEREFERALSSAPEYAVGRQWHGAALCARGRFSAGQRELRAALQLDPLSPMTGTQLAVGYYLERRYDDALRECRAVLELDPHFWAAWHFLGLCDLTSGRAEEAISHLRQAVHLSGDAPSAPHRWGMLWELAGTHGRQQK